MKNKKKLNEKIELNQFNNHIKAWEKMFCVTRTRDLLKTDQLINM